MQRQPGGLISPRSSANTRTVQYWLGLVVLLVGLTTFWNAQKTFSMRTSEDPSSTSSRSLLQSALNGQNISTPSLIPTAQPQELNRNEEEVPVHGDENRQTPSPSLVLPTVKRLPSAAPSRLQAVSVVNELSKGEGAAQDDAAVCHVGTKKVEGVKVPVVGPGGSGLKIGVLQITWGKVQPYYKRVEKLHQKYCEMHGYEYLWVHDHVKVDPSYDHENKQFVLSEFIARFDYVLYMDIDCMIWNNTVRLEDFIVEHPKADIILPGHVHGFSVVGKRIKPMCDGKHCGINSGIFLLRRSCWSMKLFNLWCALNTIPFPSGGDQVRLHFIVENNLLDIRQHAGFVAAYRMNTDDSLVVEGKSNKPRGDFTAHLWGGLKGHFDKTLKEIENGEIPSLFVNRGAFALDKTNSRLRRSKLRARISKI